METLEEEESSGTLIQSMIILATDNSTVEAALYPGNSSSPKLFDLVVRFRALELQTGSKFIVTHVSGERMKAQGTDGLSRGQLREDVSLGRAMESFCPWGKSALERSPNLESWLKSWIGSDAEVLSPSQWFTRGHDHLGGDYDKIDKNGNKCGYWRVKTKPGKFIWHPPPGAADAMLEELRKS